MSFVVGKTSTEQRDDYEKNVKSKLGWIYLREYRTQDEYVTLVNIEHKNVIPRRNTQKDTSNTWETWQEYLIGWD